MSQQLRIYGITYADKQTEYIPFVNDKPEKPWRWENGPMISISDNLLHDLDQNDIVGVVSWKFGAKTGITRADLEAKMDGAKADVFSFSPYLGDHIHFMNWSDQGHPGIKDFIRRCCAYCGIKYTNDPRHVIYANQFLATKKVYQAYINDVIKPSLQLLEGDLWEEVNKEAGYTRAMRKDKLKSLMGLEFYNYIPFILERMMSQYAQYQGLKVIQMI